VTMAAKIIFDQDVMHMMALFDQVTRAGLRDCIKGEELIIFIVEPGEIAKAIGKGGSNIKLLERKLNKRVKVVEFAEDACKFAANLMYPAQIAGCQYEEKRILMEPADMNSRGIMIGRNASSLRRTEEIVKRYFDIEQIKVR